ncbi:MAG TPA: hypothetical protein DCP02_00575 [Actinobacteria bacterium]|nr:hypothetical protein [Actinomycetota bacterium]
MGFISDIIERLDPYTGIIILALAVLITIFAGFSKNNGIKIFVIIVNALSYTAAFYLIIYSFTEYGSRDGFLTSISLPELILSCIILFIGLNVLFFISISKFSDDSFIRIVILLTFTLIPILSLIMADNMIFIFTAFALTILSIFTLISSLDRESTGSGEAIGKFGIRTILPPTLIFLGFSVLIGAGGAKNLSGYGSAENAADPLLLLSAIIFACAFYLYFFLYPFQGPYLRIARRVSGGAVSVLWFLYMPAGIILLIKFNRFFGIFGEKNNIYAFIIITVFAFLNLFGAVVGAIRAVSLKRILSMFIIFEIGTMVLIRSAGSAGMMSGHSAGYYDLTILLIILIVFLPLQLLVMLLEKNTGKDIIAGTSGLVYKNAYIVICAIILFIWWIAANVYIFTFGKFISGSGLMSHGPEGLILFIGYILALLLMAANIFRMILVFFKKLPETGETKKHAVPRVFYAYISVFVLLALSILILVIIGKMGIGQDHIKIWGSSYDIFNSRN